MRCETGPAGADVSLQNNLGYHMHVKSRRRPPEFKGNPDSLIARLLQLHGMRLTRFTDNALRCLLLLGLEPERCITVSEIADRMNMSYEHLVKIVHRLSDLGYVETVRGRHGGVRIAKAAADISIGTLVRQTEENLVLVECFDPEHNTCPIASACELTSTLDEALQAFLAVLDRKTLADILEPRVALAQLLVRRSVVTANSA